MTQRARQTHQAEPSCVAQARPLALGYDRPMMIVRTEAFRCKPMRGVFHGCKAASAVKQRVILLCFLSLPYAGCAVGMVGIIMVLVHSLYDSGGVHVAGAGMARVPHQPVVPTRAANNECRRILVIEAARKSEIVDPLRRALLIRIERKAAHRRFPIRGGKVHRWGDVGVPTLPGPPASPAPHRPAP